MTGGNYGKEAFDLRLTILRLISKIHIILALTVFGTLLFGGGYYLKNVVLRTEKFYEATAVFRVEYAVEKELEVGTVYINETSWNTYMQSDLFLDALLKHLAQDNVLPDGERLNLTKQEARTFLKAYLASDLRVPSIKVTTDSAEKSLLIAAAAQKAMQQEFAESLREIVSISIVDGATEAVEVVPDVRVGRAFLLSAVLTGFFAVVIFLLKETWDDGIWLPVSVSRRYGIKVVGTYNSPVLQENMKYFFRDAQKIAVCAAGDNVNPAEVLEELRKRAEDVVTKQWFAAPAPILCPEVCEELRKADGVLLAIKAGARAGKDIELAIEFLEQQDCKVLAGILTDADERLIRRYYCMRRKEGNGK